MYEGEIRCGDIWSRSAFRVGPFVWGWHGGKIELRSYGSAAVIVNLVSEIELRQDWHLLRSNEVGTLVAAKLLEITA